jgi:hypothetical protein
MWYLERFPYLVSSAGVVLIFMLCSAWSENLRHRWALNDWPFG